MDHYLAHLRTGGYPETTIDTRRQHLHFLARRIGTDPGDVTSESLSQWCAEQAWKPESRRGRNNSFRFFWKWASSQGLLPNVAESLPSVRQRQGIPRVAPEDIYHRALTRGDDRTRLILRLAGECGLRRGEIATIHTGRDLIEDLVGWSLIVNGKGEKQRLVPLPMGLASRLLAADRGWLFPGAVQGHISVEWVGRLASQVLEEGWTLHVQQTLPTAEGHPTVSSSAKLQPWLSPLRLCRRRSPCSPMFAFSGPANIICRMSVSLCRAMQRSCSPGCLDRESPRWRSGRCTPSRSDAI